jgi:hypothetical protein
LARIVAHRGPGAGEARSHQWTAQFWHRNGSQRSYSEEAVPGRTESTVAVIAADGLLESRDRLLSIEGLVVEFDQDSARQPDPLRLRCVAAAFAERSALSLFCGNRQPLSCVEYRLEGATPPTTRRVDYSRDSGGETARIAPSGEGPFTPGARDLLVRRTFALE